MAKNRLRRLSYQEPSDEELDVALRFLESPDVPDMIAAVLGAAIVEYALETVLKLRFKHHDDEAWLRVIDTVGPLRDFHTKIVTGFALGVFGEEVRINLNLVRDVRNVFAHSRTYLRFDHPVLGNALISARPVRSGKRLHNSVTLSIGENKRAYLNLCFSLYSFFLQKLQDSLRRSERRLREARRDQEVLDRLLEALKADRAARQRRPA
jgi:hypothetical protein